MEQGKTHKIEKKAVYLAWLAVKANKGAAGVDGVEIKDFECKLKENLYKIWNRMRSGSYMAKPVRKVLIEKADGGTRPLGIPTVEDRVAQQVAVQYLEPKVEPYFHKDSYGYRPNKRAHDAVAVTRERCWKFNWVIDLDIKGFFENLDHELLMKAVNKHSPARWISIYTERWLRAPVQDENGTLVNRTKGTPQGGVISPILANLFLHYAFDTWMKQNHPGNPFARYADDIVIHCRTKEEAVTLLETIRARLKQCNLELNSTKTQIVYCKDASRKEAHPKVTFDFLGFTFGPRMARTRRGIIFLSFLPAVSRRARCGMRRRFRELNLRWRTLTTVEEIANIINPIFQGMNRYYGAFYASKMIKIVKYVNALLIDWARCRYKRFGRSYKRTGAWLARLYMQNRGLFAHWSTFAFSYYRG